MLDHTFSSSCLECETDWLDLRNQNGGILTTQNPWLTFMLSHLLVIEKESFDELGLADG